jgi:trimeric autotransporter adhesin
VLVPSVGGTQAVVPDLGGVDPGSNVLSVARLGNAIYIAGNFRSVGPNTGGGVPLNHISGEPKRPFARVTGQVFAVIPDQQGGWYIGGRFTAVGGVPRANLAHILADGSVAPWSPAADGDVASLASWGHTIYIGGWFTSIDAASRRRIAAVDGVTGNVSDWNPDVPDFWGSVNALVAENGIVYAGGFFSYLGGKRRNCIAALDAHTGIATDWDPEAQYTVNALAVSGDLVYAGGFFTAIGGQPRNMIAALDAKTGLATAFDAQASGTRPNEYVPWNGVYSLAVRGKTLYVGGYFDHMGGQERISLAALDAATGDATGWDPALGGVPYVYALAVHDGELYAGGAFSSLGGRTQDFLAALDATTGSATEWNPRPNFDVYALATSDDAVYAGGFFTSMWNWQRRIHIAALDATTGAVRPWNPNPDGFVTQLAVGGGTVYAGGNFGTIGQQPRSGIAALDTLTGAATAWNPSANGVVATMLVSGQTLYVAGGFGLIGGKSRSHAAALDLATGEVKDWDPRPDDAVYAMAQRESTIYMGGFFEHVGGQQRLRLAAVDTGSGAIMSWNPRVDSFVKALAVIGRTVYVGGAYSTIGGRPRNSLAAVDAITGAVLPWNPDPSPGDVIVPYIYAMVAIGDTLYVGGDFSAIGGQSRRDFAAVDATTGGVLAWDPSPDGIVWGLSVSGRTLYAGGGFSRFGELPCSGLAAISMEPLVPPSPTNSRATLSLISPNPVLSSASARFTLLSAGLVTLDVFDMQGRRIASLMTRQPQSAGWHDEPLHAERWPTGVYFCRLEVAGGVSATRKFVVLR